MYRRLTNADSTRHAAERIRELIDAHGEWLCARDRERSVPLHRSECDFRVSQGRLIFSCWGERGVVTWRVIGWEWVGGKLLLEASRRMGAERARLELIPRASASAATAAVGEKRRERCSRLANLASAVLPGLKVERAGLSAGARAGQPGRYARILLRHLNRERIAVAGEVTDSQGQDVDAYLSSALVWFARASETARPPHVRRLWLIAGGDLLESLGQRMALLREGLRRNITLYRIDEEWQRLTPVGAPQFAELWAERPQRFRRPPPAAAMTESAAHVLSLSPEAIDVVRARRGETLRFRGLAFARVRRVAGSENIWFGVEGAGRRLLDDGTREEWSKLLRDLREHRSAEAADQHHALYRAAPEAWLESELRRDVTRLDPGLRLAPLYAQFRPSPVGGLSRPIDLLALRRDGRLVVIELKVSEDRQHVLQGADYWRRTEIHRRRGHVARARLFGDAAISDEPPLVYLVAPTLRFHRSFDLLARAIAPEVELYRIEINDDWRASGVRVMRRTRAN